ncbi:MAG TPA: tRNA 2-thiouridine(34) synthase MnmA [Firmicutes bacterium]|nr:tRNA 2-thiouridine(34) synthase MnmA [Bacillota bacterium]
MCTTKERARVLVALSGGVDSSVCTYLLQQQGYSVEGVVLRMSPAHDPVVRAAQETADTLGIPLHVINAEEEFSQTVIKHFCREYQNGRTPNPCILCNPLIKFRLIVEKADELGFSYIATGHYADLKTLENGRIAICKASCLKRDQSYMLYRLTQYQLSKLLLPLSHLEKTEVREIAEQAGLPSAQTADSQENCFIPDNDYAAYIEAHDGPGKQGYFLSPEGEIVAPHKGIPHYTVGQRKRLGIALGKPVFIKSIDAQSGNIQLAWSGDEYASGILLSEMVYQPFETLTRPISCQVKIRSMAKDAPATLIPLEDGRAKILFEQPQRAPAPGQSCVCYDRTGMILGGGFIDQQIEV